MKIVEQTQTRLQLEAKPFTAWFFASAQLIAGLAFVYGYISTMPAQQQRSRRSINSFPRIQCIDFFKK